MSIINEFHYIFCINAESSISYTLEKEWLLIEIIFKFHYVVYSSKKNYLFIGVIYRSFLSNLLNETQICLQRERISKFLIEIANPKLTSVTTSKASSFTNKSLYQDQDVFLTLFPPLFVNVANFHSFPSPHPYMLTNNFPISKHIFCFPYSLRQ